MSNHLALATVTATLRELLREAVEVEVAGAGVSMVRPDELTAVQPPVGINIYLYSVSPNAAYRNADLPTRRSDGSLMQQPQSALDLHYLLTCHGNDNDLEPQRVLGSAVRRLHARPQLTRQRIRATVGNVASFPYLQGSDLAEQVELIKFTPLSLSLEELSKLWSVFFQTPYRLSTAYLATVVLMEAEEKTPREALPVRERNVYAIPFRQPVIEYINARAGDGQIITVDSTLVITGKRLRGEVTRLRIGKEEVAPPPENIADTEITFDLSILRPITLWAGLQGVQVIHRLMMGTPPTEHTGVESDVAPIVLRPKISKKISASGQALDEYDIEVSDTVLAPNATVAGAATMKLDPKVGKTQRVLLLLNEFNAEPPVAYTFPAERRDQASETVRFPISGVYPRDYLVRVQVDGAQSVLEVDEDPASPTYNQYVRPRIQIEAPDGDG